MISSDHTFLRSFYSRILAFLLIEGFFMEMGYVGVGLAWRSRLSWLYISRLRCGLSSATNGWENIQIVIEGWIIVGLDDARLIMVWLMIWSSGRRTLELHHVGFLATTCLRPIFIGLAWVCCEILWANLWWIFELIGTHLSIDMLRIPLLARDCTRKRLVLGKNLVTSGHLICDIIGLMRTTERSRTVVGQLLSSLIIVVWLRRGDYKELRRYRSIVILGVIVIATLILGWLSLSIVTILVSIGCLSSIVVTVSMILLVLRVIVYSWGIAIVWRRIAQSCLTLHLELLLLLLITFEYVLWWIIVSKRAFWCFAIFSIIFVFHSRRITLIIIFPTVVAACLVILLLGMTELTKCCIWLLLLILV